MKKIIALLGILTTLQSQLKAAPGDTTWVQAHQDVWMDWYNNFDESVTFPDGSSSYRKIFMFFTLGKYSCPGNPQYCADWDYTVQTILMTPDGDTVELGRLITPYANSQRMTASWKGVYIFDVTDFYPLLKDQAGVRVHYSGYSGGFTANVRFAFIEGTPARNVVGVTPVWKGSFNYGHGSIPINTALSNVSLTAPSGTVSAEARFTITGHGGDSQNCAEFCPNTYTMNLNNTQLVQQNFWNDKCGYNNYYPQNGTWVYDRAGWCPGELVPPYKHILTGITSNSTYNLNVTFPAYTSNPSSSGSQASYIIENSIIYYGGFNKSLDASLNDIIAPTDFEAYFRKNPENAKPVVRIQNDGSTTITSMLITYGVVGEGSMYQHTWTGSLAPLQTEDIQLPHFPELYVATGTNTFVAKILEVNGQADEDLTNNELSSVFTAPEPWPVHIRIQLKTNKSTVGGYSETSWKIYDADGVVVAQRVQNAPETTYLDSLELWPGSYRLEVTDLGCDGVNWWVYPYYNPNPGVGNVVVRKMGSNAPLSLKGYYNGDFGCGFTHFFTTSWPTSIEENNPVAQNASMEVFPNPAKNNLTVLLTGISNSPGVLQILDPLGRVVLTQAMSRNSETISLSSLSAGSYIVVYQHNLTGKKMHARLVVTK